MRLLRRVKRLSYVLFFVVLSPAVAAVFFLVLVFSLPQAFSADRNEGLRGSYTVTDIRAGGPRASGSVAGTFTSYDGTVELEDVSIDGGVDRVGQTIQAQYFADSWSGSGVFPLDPNAVRWMLLLALAPLAWLAFWAWRVFFASRRRRPQIETTKADVSVI